jgi:hypothetical protein
LKGSVTFPQEHGKLVDIECSGIIRPASNYEVGNVIAVEVTGKDLNGPGIARTPSWKLCYLKRGLKRGALRVEQRRRERQAEQPG